MLVAAAVLALVVVAAFLVPRLWPGAGPAVARPPAPTEIAPVPVDPATLSQPRYSYADAIREQVLVPTDFDTDGDDEPDLMSIDIVRPTGAGQVPVILEASPYYKEPGRGWPLETKKVDANGVVTDPPLYYDNYFVPRGYAFVAMDLPGTMRSTGCMDVLGP